MHVHLYRIHVCCRRCALFEFRVDRLGRQGYRRQTVFTFVPSHYSCIIPPLLAAIVLLSVCFGIPSEHLRVYQRDRLAIKSSHP